MVGASSANQIIHAYSKAVSNNAIIICNLVIMVKLLKKRYRLTPWRRGHKVGIPYGCLSSAFRVNAYG